MKKRSLFAAVAMLIVSAVVLTSATYAWFAGNATVGVQQMTTYVSASSGSISISADNQDWSKLTITQDDLDVTKNANANGVFPAAMSPIDFSISGANITKYLATFGTGANGNKMTLSSASSVANTYVNYTFYVKANQADTTAYLVPGAFTDGTGFCYMAVKVGSTGTWTVYSADNNTYYPLTATSGTVTDTNNDKIASVGDAEIPTGHAGSYIATTSQSTTTVSSTPYIALDGESGNPAKLGTTATPISVVVWAEGQDPQCTSCAGTEQIKHSFTVTLTQPT